MNMTPEDQHSLDNMPQDFVAGVTAVDDGDDNFEPYQVYQAAPVQAVVTIKDDTAKRGHVWCKCCCNCCRNCCRNCCCNTRLAVIIVNVVYLCFLIIDLFGTENAWIIGYLLLLMIASITGIVGAQRYNHYLVVVAAVPHLADITAICTINQDFSIMLPISIVFLYPHVMFVKEFSNGIMTRETYSMPESRHRVVAYE